MNSVASILKKLKSKEVSAVDVASQFLGVVDAQ